MGEGRTLLLIHMRKGWSFFGPTKSDPASDAIHPPANDLVKPDAKELGTSDLWWVQDREAGSSRNARVPMAGGRGDSESRFFKDCPRPVHVTGGGDEDDRRPAFLAADRCGLHCFIMRICADPKAEDGCFDELPMFDPRLGGIGLGDELPRAPMATSSADEGG